ncbi:MAG: hypothetical protein JSW54_07355 [Fidelibacterota bacterium]|nr:MAG: hypothetical protein JSW54_07355 [Candidatus Neomarinimicrobiota bacterium]
MRSFLLLAFNTGLFLWVTGSDSLQVASHPDTLEASPEKASLVMPLFHNPPVAILNDRPFRMDLFVNIQPEDIESVSLFIRVDTTENFEEIPLDGKYRRYRYILPQEELRGNALIYYFLVVLKDYSLYAYPVNEDSLLEPFVIDLVPPTLEFFQKELYD